MAVAVLAEAFLCQMLPKARYSMQISSGVQAIHDRQTSNVLGMTQSIVAVIL